MFIQAAVELARDRHIPSSIQRYQHDWRARTQDDVGCQRIDVDVPFRILIFDPHAGDAHIALNFDRAAHDVDRIDHRNDLRRIQDRFGDIRQRANSNDCDLFIGILQDADDQTWRTQC